MLSNPGRRSPNRDRLFTSSIPVPCKLCVPEIAGRMPLVLATLAIMAAIILVVAWLGVARIVMPEGGKMGSNSSGYVDAWGQGPSEETVNSVRIGGIGSTAYGRDLKVKVMDRKGRGVLDLLSWKIDAPISPDLMFKSPISSDSIGAVLIAIE